MKVGLFVLVVGCVEKSSLRVGADRSMKSLGLIELLLAAFEQERSVPTRLVYDDALGLVDRANANELDDLFVISEATIEALGSIPIRQETYAHEELILIGPFENALGSHTGGDAVEMIRNVARSNHRLLEGRKGSAEWAKVRNLVERSRERLPDSFLATDLEGVDLVEHAIAERAFALVKRSALLEAAARGRRPHRIYREGDRDLALRLFIVEVHPSKARTERRPELFDFVMSDKGLEILEGFGPQRFGFPLLVAGEPAE